MISSTPSSRVLLLSVPGTAAEIGPGSLRIRRYRLARVRAGARPPEAGGGGVGPPEAKPRS